ncbi:hypothetical protein ACLMJK_006445 [Lecanora helva]
MSGQQKHPFSASVVIGPQQTPSAGFDIHGWPVPGPPYGSNMDVSTNQWSASPYSQVHGHSSSAQPQPVGYPQQVPVENYVTYPTPTAVIMPQSPAYSGDSLLPRTSHDATPIQLPSSQKSSCCGSQSNADPVTPSSLEGSGHATAGQHLINQQHDLRENVAEQNQSFGNREPSEFQQTLSIPDNGCQCGPSCNCVFCTKHPTNPATRNRIGEIYSIMDQQPGFDDPSSPSAPGYNNFTYAPSSFEAQPSLPDQNHFTPHHYGVGETSFDDRVGEPDYFEMAYPVAGCKNGYCRCGESCSCVGCLTHEGHVPEAPSS